MSAYHGIIEDARRRMEKSLDSFQYELSRVRTGRASPSLVENVMVSCYGSESPLCQVATIAAQDACTLVVTPWDKNLVPDIEKAILNANLGLNPLTQGHVIRVPMPPLNEERRRELIRIVRTEAEQARIAVRNIRRDAKQGFKQQVKQKLLSEDEERQGEEQVQKLTDDYVGRIDSCTAGKEKEMMEI